MKLKKNKKKNNLYVIQLTWEKYQTTRTHLIFDPSALTWLISS